MAISFELASSSILIAAMLLLQDELLAMLMRWAVLPLFQCVAARCCCRNKVVRKDGMPTKVQFPTLEDERMEKRSRVRRTAEEEFSKWYSRPPQLAYSPSSSREGAREGSSVSSTATSRREQSRFASECYYADNYMTFPSPTTTNSCHDESSTDIRTGQMDKPRCIQQRTQSAPPSTDSSVHRIVNPRRAEEISARVRTKLLGITATDATHRRGGRRRRRPGRHSSVMITSSSSSDDNNVPSQLLLPILIGR